MTNRPEPASSRQKASSHQSMEAPRPMTSRTGGLEGSPKDSVQSSTPFTSTSRSTISGRLCKSVSVALPRGKTYDRTMTAAYYHGGGKFSIGDARLENPGPGEVRLDVAYCGVCGTDLHIAHGAMDARVHPPQVIGHEMSGTVAELGAGV